MKPLDFHPEALAEARHEQAYYEDRQEGLGFEFRETLDAALDVIELRPHSVKRRDGPYQKYSMARFPFEIVFREFGTYIQIIAVKHNKREPNSWKHRISTET